MYDEFNNNKPLEYMLEIKTVWLKFPVRSPELSSALFVNTAGCMEAREASKRVLPVKVNCALRPVRAVRFSLFALRLCSCSCSCSLVFVFVFVSVTGARVTFCQVVNCQSEEQNRKLGTRYY